jgi:hypothetical protein
MIVSAVAAMTLSATGHGIVYDTKVDESLQQIDSPWHCYTNWTRITGEAECGASACASVDDTWDLAPSVGMSVAWFEASVQLTLANGTREECANSDSDENARVIGYYSYHSTFTKFHYEWWVHRQDSDNGIDTRIGPCGSDHILEQRIGLVTQKAVQFCPEKPGTWPECKRPTDKNGSPDYPVPDPPCSHEGDDKADNPTQCPYPKSDLPTKNPDSGSEPLCARQH